MTARRIAVCGLSHETNTYSPHATRLADFEVWEGQAVLDVFSGSDTSIGGILDAARAAGLEPVPGLVCVAEPAGVIEADAYRELKRRLLASVRAAGDVELVAIDLHGAAIAEGVDDVEGDLAAALRELVPAAYVGAVLDLHGNPSDALVAQLDIALGLHLYPHVDEAERGAELVRLLAQIADRGVRPFAHVEHLPMLVPPALTDRAPAAEINQLCWQQEELPGMLDCTFFHGFPYVDSARMGAHVVATAEGSAELAQRCARKVAERVWELREAFRLPSIGPDEAIRQALATSTGLAVVNETNDNPGGGAPGDGTALLAALLRAGVPDACFASIADPEVAAAAHAAGPGATIDVRLGGKREPRDTSPVSAQAYVKTVADGRFTMQVLARGTEVDLGRSARLRIGDVDVIVTSRAEQTFEPEIFLLHGIDVTRRPLVGLKSSNHFRAAFAPIASTIVTCDGPGLTSLQVERFPRRRNDRPLWPIDQETETSP
jgi:microcystin degradation protein MlrC